MDILIVASDADIPILEHTIRDIIIKMKPSGIKVVTNVSRLSDKIRNVLEESSDGIIEWIDEDKLYPGLTFAAVKDELTRVMGEEPVRNRVGWYFQQFLKMAYAFYIEDEDYFQMDADVLPLRSLPVFDDGIPAFFVRKEYNELYFETMYRLLGIKKQIEMSFISETMLFKTDVMREIVNRIDRDEGLTGDGFWRKILNSINPDKINGSGFSEYETYGTYVLVNHPGSYNIRQLPSLRSGKRFLGNEPSGDVKDWAAKSYYYAGIEKWDKESAFWGKMNGNAFFRHLCSLRAEAFIDRNISRLCKKWSNV